MVSKADADDSHLCCVVLYLLVDGRAYRKLALRLHPDKASSAIKCSMSLGDGYGVAVGDMSALQERLREGANELFGMISTAHEELGDAVRRRKVSAGLVC